MQRTPWNSIIFLQKKVGGLALVKYIFTKTTDGPPIVVVVCAFKSARLSIG